MKTTERSKLNIVWTAALMCALTCLGSRPAAAQPSPSVLAGPPSAIGVSSRYKPFGGIKYVSVKSSHKHRKTGMPYVSLPQRLPAGKCYLIRSVGPKNVQVKLRVIKQKGSFHSVSSSNSRFARRKMAFGGFCMKPGQTVTVEFHLSRAGRVAYRYFSKHRLTAAALKGMQAKALRELERKRQACAKKCVPAMARCRKRCRSSRCRRACVAKGRFCRQRCRDIGTVRGRANRLPWKSCTLFMGRVSRCGLRFTGRTVIMFNGSYRMCTFRDGWITSCGSFYSGPAVLKRGGGRYRRCKVVTGQIFGTCQRGSYRGKVVAQSR